MAYKYKKEFPDILFKTMAKGHSFEAAVTDLGVHRDTGFTWVKKYPEFAEAKKKGEAAALKFLEQLAIAKLTGVIPPSLKAKGSKKLSSTMIIFFLKTRFHKIYGEKMKLEGDSAGGEMVISLNYKKPEKKKDDKDKTKKD